MSSLRVLVGLALSVAALAACGSDEELDGFVTISGSSTLLPMMSLVIADFSQEHPYVRMDLDSPGTADGFKLFCDGLIHLNDASRRMNAKETEACRESGVSFVELAVAQDAIVVFTSPRNQEVDCLTLEQLYGLVGPESAGLDSWAATDADLPVPDDVQRLLPL